MPLAEWLHGSWNCFRWRSKNHSFSIDSKLWKAPQLPPHENSVSLHRQRQALPRRLLLRQKTRELSRHMYLLGSSSLSQKDQFLTSAGEISLGTGVGDGRHLKNSQRVSFYVDNWIASISVQNGWMSPLEVMIDSISRANYCYQGWFSDIWLCEDLFKFLKFYGD